MSEPFSDALMARVLAGEATPEEVAQVEAWAAESPVHRGELARLRAAFAARGAPGVWDADRAWAKVASRVAADHTAAEVIPIPAAPRWPTTVMRLAAAILLVVGVGVAWQALRSPVAPTLHASGSGQRLEVSLPDGSMVVLAPRSTLRVPADFAADREVALEGEAWFEVVHDDAHPFTVTVAGFDVRDLGTRFTVDGRRPATVVVTVLEGEVLVHHRSGELADAALTPGQVGRFVAPAFGREGRAAVTSGAPVEVLTSWREGALALVDAPVGEALERLAAWYGVAFTLADSSDTGRRITATLSLDSIEEAGSVLALLLGTEVVRDSTGITFR